MGRVGISADDVDFVGHMGFSFVGAEVVVVVGFLPFFLFVRQSDPATSQGSVMRIP
jgi:hypothetical protein